MGERVSITSHLLRKGAKGRRELRVRTLRVAVTCVVRIPQTRRQAELAYHFASTRPPGLTERLRRQ